MIFLLDPPRGVGRLVLGDRMDRAIEALRELGEPRAVRPAVSSAPSWFLARTSGLSIRVDFDEGHRLSAIEFGSGPGTEDKVLYRGLSLFDGRVLEVLTQLRQTVDIVDSDDEPGYSFTAPSLLMALWRSTLPESPEDPDGGYFESVLIARPGYYTA